MDSKFFLVLLTILLPIVISVVGQNPDTELLQEYLRINTSHPNPDYNSAIAWIKQQALNLSLEFNSFELNPNGSQNRPVAWLTWRGTKPNLSSILLYNHMDVTPVHPNAWTVDPFSGVVIDGKVYGRGAQDMKSTGIQHLQAIRNLKVHGLQPIRTVHVAFFPEEEKGGYLGMELFKDTEEFKRLNIGFALDEGMPNEAPNILNVYYTERKMMWLTFLMNGTQEHGSFLPNNTAGEKLQKVINRMLQLRESEKRRLRMDTSLRLGDVTSINLNKIEGGIQENVTPPWLSATFDIRVTPHWNLTEFELFLNETSDFAGNGVSYHTLNNSTMKEPNAITDLTTKTWWWERFQVACQLQKLEIHPRIFPAGTDGRILRKIGVPVLGISTIFNTPNLMHSPDEYLLIDDFLRGIEIYSTLIEQLVTSASDDIHELTDATGSHANPNYISTKPKNPGSSSANEVTSITLWFNACAILEFQALFLYFTA